MTPSKNVSKTPGSTTASNRVDLLSIDGMSMIMLLIILAVAGVAMAGIMSMGNIQRRSQSQSMVPSQIVTIRGNILNMLKNDSAWDNTASDPHNTGLVSCYKSAVTPCIGSGINLIQILNATDSNSSPTYYANAPLPITSLHRGFALDGSNCNTYPSEDCPIAMEVFWSCTPSSGTTGCDLASNYSNMQFQVIPHYNPIRLSTGQRSPDAIILDETKYVIGPILRTAITNPYNFP